MIYLLFIVSCILTFLCITKKRSLDLYITKRRSLKRRSQKLLYYFLESSNEFLLPLTIVTFFYVVLSLIVTLSPNTVTIRFLQQMEELFDHIKSFISFFNLNPLQVALILVIAYTLNLMRIPFVETGKLLPYFRKYRKVISKVNLVIVVLCCFTFFGYQLGTPTANLRFRINEIRQGYADLQKQIESTMSESVQRKVFGEVLQAFPSSYLIALSYPEKLNEKGALVHKEYETAKLSYGINIQAAEDIVKRQSLYEQWNENHKNKPIKYSEASFKVEPTLKEISSNASIASIEEAKKSITESKETFKSRLISLLKLDKDQELLCQFPTYITGQIKSKILESVLIKFPIIDPGLDVFVSAIDKNLEERLKAAVEGATNAVIEHPESGKSIIDKKAIEVANSAKIEIKKPTLDKANQAATLLQNELQEMERVESQIIEQEKYARERKRREKEAIEATRKYCTCYYRNRFLVSRSHPKCPCKPSTL